MKGIILADGSGSELSPASLAVSRQLLPVGDKPLIYYPLAVLMLADIREILVISTRADLPQFHRLLGDGAQLGLSIDYVERSEPGCGAAGAFVVGADHIGDDSVALILGDNIFHGHSLSDILVENSRDVHGCVLFGSPVKDPERHFVGITDTDGRLLAIDEKPQKTVSQRSNRAITGLYFYDNDVLDLAKNLRRSGSDTFELAEINWIYLEQGSARLVDLGNRCAWLEPTTMESLFQASLYVHTLQERQGVRIACLEEIALRMGFIGPEQCHRLGARLAGSAYGRYVMAVAAEPA